MSSVALACARRRLQPPALVAAQMRSQPWSSNAAPSHPVHVQIMKELIKSTGPWQLLRVYESYSAEYDSSLAMATINRIAMNGVKKAVLLSKPWPADGSDARIASDERFQALLTIPTLALQQNVSRTHAFHRLDAAPFRRCSARATGDVVYSPDWRRPRHAEGVARSPEGGPAATATLTCRAAHTRPQALAAQEDGAVPPSDGQAGGRDHRVRAWGLCCARTPYSYVARRGCAASARAFCDWRVAVRAHPAAPCVQVRVRSVSVSCGLWLLLPRVRCATVWTLIFSAFLSPESPRGCGAE